ncbi:uncharacterized protein DFL_007444 [Arthrobotrys flagrans]|uniref:TATA element modulatory factor 1 TATA binding domain-containing protein n=1 Tax=Arthrobotrys flagrans TaxID=97331 RepID=A0A436ZVP6_ARTFL|nr:hypothetical protein DFL_007444 [Arthrobotrys flagrans]
MNFLQRAVAGVESRLDQVLASDPNIMVDSSSSNTAGNSNSVSNTSATTTTSNSTTAVTQAPVVVKDVKPTPPTSASPTPPPGMGRMTMQERLAAAMARSGGTRSASPAVGSLSERAASPSPSPAVRRSIEDTETVRKSIDVPVGDKTTTTTSSEEAPKVEPTTEAVALPTESKPSDDQEQPSTNGVESTPTDPSPLRTNIDAPRKSLESQPRASIDAKPRASPDSRPRASIDKSRTSVDQAVPPVTTASTPLPTAPTIEELESTIAQLCEDLTACESRRSEESSAASERIDSLEEKLKYLSKESAEEARKRIQTGGSSALEKELAKRDERIALLLEEGERLSKIELKHMNNIKRLRAKAQEDEKATAEAKRKQEKAEKEAADLKEKTKKAVEAEKRANERLRAMNKLEVDNEGLKRERDILQISTSDLKLQLAKAVARADDAESKVQTEALEAERKLTAELREKLEKAQNDAMADKERSKSEIWTLQSKLERDGDRAKAVELELKNEVSMLETKLEVMRARAEEASTGTSGHTHAKLLRQIETLQSQYAVASENWQGIEASLVTRLTNIEKERDEHSRKEGDIRRKAREVNQKLKRLESDLESANLKVQDLESSLATQLTLCDDLRKQVTLHEDSKLQLTKKQEEERTAWQKEINNLRDSLKTASSAIVDDYASRPKSRPNSILEAEGAIRPLSPNPRPRKQSIGSDMNAPFPSKRMSRTESGDRLNEGPGSYRRPTLPEPTRQYTPSWGPTTPDWTPYRVIMVVYLVKTHYLEDLEARVWEWESRHEGRNGGGAHLGEILSVSTVAAGPSVQLVERMSAAVRRLESEMASSREELVRMTAQRDEARAEVVAFMTEVDEKRSLEARVQTLEADLKEKDGAYEATLVMLGEKSEEVEELKNDVADLKQMYRDLIMSQTNS